MIRLSDTCYFHRGAILSAVIKRTASNYWGVYLMRNSQDSNFQYADGIYRNPYSEFRKGIIPHSLYAEGYRNHLSEAKELVMQWCGPEDAE